MAQGSIKMKARPAKAPTKKTHSKKQQSRGGGGAISKPQRPNDQKFTSGLVGRTEQLLGERAGHLELIGKGKKTEASDKIGGKGGSKKFG
ncbi:unnamed protein product [Parascedosporium putredinis]|uniref:Uncharacterized protein n=1 Tax=Parascedosporium putredinis TaxID=1442378 RepID=A0A9P1M8Q6_9PEZI|nr:unnamed protein product [Parascedosporium putredinis]CAI7990369.1 unnamed protein product [Parascedosporium putredinis]